MYATSILEHQHVETRCLFPASAWSGLFESQSELATTSMVVMDFNHASLPQPHPEFGDFYSWDGIAINHTYAPLSDSVEHPHIHQNHSLFHV